MPPEPQAGAPLAVDASVWQDRIAGSREVGVPDLAPPGSRLLVVSPHPDDETIGAGALVAEWAARVGPVDAIVLSAGEACFGDTGEQAEAVGTRRLAEWYSAVTALGAVPHGCAHLPDHHLGEHEDAIRDILLALAPTAAAVATTWSGDPHPDHVATGRTAAAVAAETQTPLLAFPVWTTYRRRPEEVDEQLLRVAASPQAAGVRDAALAHYRSQLDAPPGRGAVVEPAMLAHHHTQLLVEPRS